MGSSSTDADHSAQLRRQEAIADLSQQALETGAAAIDQLLDDVTTAVAAALDLEYCTIVESQADGTGAVYRAEGGLETDRIGATVTADRLAQIERALRADGPVVNEFPADGGVPTPLADRGVIDSAAVRIGPRDDPCGVLNAYATDRRAFTEDELAFLERVAAVLASAVENADARRDLERTERRFEAIFEDPNILVGLLEPDGTVIDINGTAMEYVAADLEDVTGEPFWETPWWGEGDDVRDDVREWTERAAAGEYVTFEADLTRPSGEQYTLEGAFRPVTDDDGNVTSVIVSDRDVTVREERERRLSTLMDNVPGMVYRCENERGWPMEFVSDACEDLTGYDPGALERDEVSWGEDVMVQADREKLWQTVQRETVSDEDGHTFSETYRIETADGERRWVRDYGRGLFNEDGDLVAVEGIIADITERKRLEAELAESEQRYRTLVEHFPNGAVALVDEDLTYRTVGGSPTDTAGVTADEVEGKTVSEAVPQPLADELVPRYERALEGESSAFETAIDGRVFDFHVVPVRDDDGEVFAALGMSQDVTERYEYERELEDAKSRLEAATEAGAVGTWEWHVPEDRMVVGETFAETFGVDPESARDGVPLDRFLEAVHEDDRDRVERKIEAALESCGEYEAEYRVRNADGEIRWVVARGRVECDADGDPVRFPGAVTDITERKRAQLQLERTTDQLETLFDVLPVGVIVADGDGEILQANDTAEEIWGGTALDARSVEEYEKYPVWWADSGERAAPEELTLARVLDGEEVTDPDIFEIETDDGERRIIRAEGMPIRNDRGEVIRGVATITDITERREYRRKLEESEQRYRTLIDNFPNGAVALFDEDLRYRIVGGTAFEEIGDAAETIVGKTVHERYPPELATRLETAFEDALEGEASSLEIAFYDRDWMTHTVPVTDDDGEIFGGMVMVQDITERKEREQKLRERERRLEQYKEYTDAILDAIDDVFYVVDEKGELQRWNRSVAEVTGYADEEIDAMSPTELIAPDDHEALFEAIRDGFETGSTSAELTVRTADGEHVPFEFNASRLADPWGNTVLAGIGRDITERLERQRRLEESERRYRTLAQHFPNGAVGVYDRDLAYTLAAGEELGATLPPADRLEGNLMPDIFPEHTVGDLEPVFRAAVEDGETTSTETTFGGRHWRVWATPLRDADGEIFAGLSFAQDVTEQVERQRHLERYETIVEEVNDGVYVVDEDGRFTTVNETYADMVGYDPDDLIGEHVSLVVDDEVADRVSDLEETVAGDAEWPTVEADLRTADGDTVPVEASFAMLPEDGGEWHRVGIVRDISDRKERERQLEESERRYRTLIENFPDGAVGLFDENLTYTVAGGQLLGEAGVQPDDRVGNSVYDTYPDEVVEEIEPYYRAALEGESNTFDVEFYGRQLHAHTLPVRNADGDIYAGMVVVQDVTERREYERKLEQSNERLERFAYAASHDLQEPLRMVTSYLQLLENRYAEAFDEDGQEFLAFAVDGADRMRDMIDGLLEYSRVETRGDSFEPADLNAVVDEVLADLQFRIEETDAEISVADLPELEADASQLRQVFQNLLSNALTYSGDEPPRVHVSADRRGDEWVLSVEDDGIGIDPADQDRVFTIFDRLHSRAEYDGTGIGLALCERIVERHGGEIWVDSEPGEGSTFSFTLPASRD
ncbi:PAS domain S-box protein [Halopiger aswanensis]|uniref:histidine kinase n=1 Tax=Halopiger aswanensis TaxID=148449 RepID=A0A419WCN2_9EURY|nr:PAS domain S-box protein [Halopiger aswanensis]RKD93253.1 PAS domain S-box-containing protein [Halopiger aswanensis]